MLTGHGGLWGRPLEQDNFCRYLFGFFLSVLKDLERMRGILSCFLKFLFSPFIRTLSCSFECLRKSKLTEVMLYRRGDGGAFERFPVHRSAWRHWFPQILEPVVPSLAARGGGGLAMVPEED